jgi:hypothetical protein
MQTQALPYGFLYAYRFLIEEFGAGAVDTFQNNGHILETQCAG